MIQYKVIQFQLNDEAVAGVYEDTRRIILNFYFNFQETFPKCLPTKNVEMKVFEFEDSFFSFKESNWKFNALYCCCLL